MRRIATARDLCKLAAYVNAGNNCAGFSASSEKSSWIQNCTANGTVNGNETCGGFVGINNGRVD